MIIFVPLAMFAAPVFDRVTDLPDPLRALAYANPLGAAIEMMRAAVLDGVSPPILAYCGFLVVSAAVCRGGFAGFEGLTGIFNDVLLLRNPMCPPRANPFTLTPVDPHHKH